MYQAGVLVRLASTKACSSEGLIRRASGLFSRRLISLAVSVCFTTYCFFSSGVSRLPIIGLQGRLFGFPAVEYADLAVPEYENNTNYPV